MCKPNLLARLYVATGLFSKRIYCCTAWATRLAEALSRAVPDDGDDRMKENDGDVVHAGIVSESQKVPEFKPILEFATGSVGILSDRGL